MLREQRGAGYQIPPAFYCFPGANFPASGKPFPRTPLNLLPFDLAGHFSARVDKVSTGEGLLYVLLSRPLQLGEGLLYLAGTSPPIVTVQLGELPLAGQTDPRGDLVSPFPHSAHPSPPFTADAGAQPRGGGGYLGCGRGRTQTALRLRMDARGIERKQHLS